MLFLWTITKRGKIWLDGDAFKQIVTDRMSSDFFCQEVSFVGDLSQLNIFITIPDQDDPKRRLALADKLEALFKPTGIAVCVHWIRKAPDEYSVVSPIWSKPAFWAAVTGGLTGIAKLGIRGILWVVGASLAGYVISWIFLSEDGNKLVKKIISDVKSIRR
ncbi:MAG: hypothetical protein FWE55_02430 [Synergistaceae bacterium]|nr:hypothetical protein [Synergistaceae bacterium]